MRTPVKFMNGSLHDWSAREVLYRSDTNAPLSIVSNDYHVVQPAAVLEFFRDLVARHGFAIETAGTMQGGKRIWALARTGFDAEVVANDPVRMYLLIVTSCDRGLSTKTYFTSVRVVCRNTLQLSTHADKQANLVMVRHNTAFRPESVHASLGLNAEEVFSEFMSKMQRMANTSVSAAQAAEIVEAIFAQHGVKGPIREKRGFRSVMQLFNGAGKGSRIDGVAGTGWGLVNAVTEYTDFHIRATSQDNRLQSAWLGNGAILKQAAVDCSGQVISDTTIGFFAAMVRS
jgi:phage/plasmid-like protein (TIGR03299 family)